MITKNEIQELLHSTETYRVERTTSTDERSKSRGQARLDYALQGGRRREPTGDMDKFQEAICAFANDNGGNIGGDIVENVVGKDLNDVEKPSDVVDNVVENKKNVVENIFASISKNSTISTKKLAAMYSLSERQVQRIMTKLKEQSVIRRIGPDKGGHWEIIAP
ncbi:putative DNA binding domain-containing protein [Segatella bryantii]|uniref:hypothetical protein n=1 Tax=Segatella bryantii TaxID=77095 RepID=UPI001EDAB3F2|nr:hypothetical protein [Segatella bryantii]UKK80535.1 hypothetical protein L6474_07685 [Segatella bryantii]